MKTILMILTAMFLYSCSEPITSGNQIEFCQGYIRIGNNIQRCHIPVVPPETRCNTGLHQ